MQLKVHACIHGYTILLTYVAIVIMYVYSYKHKSNVHEHNYYYIVISAKMQLRVHGYLAIYVCAYRVS